MRICKIIATKRVIGMSTDVLPGVLTQNAFVEFGLTSDLVEEMEVDHSSYQDALTIDPVVIALEQVKIDEKSKIDRIRNEILSKFPTRKAVSDAIDAAPNTIAAVKSILKSGFDVLYLHVTNKES
jgi:hypothetical protein